MFFSIIFDTIIICVLVWISASITAYVQTRTKKDVYDKPLNVRESFGPMGGASFGLIIAPLPALIISVVLSLLHISIFRMLVKLVS